MQSNIKLCILQEIVNFLAPPVATVVKELRSELICHLPVQVN